MENEGQAIILPRTEDLLAWLFLLVIVIILLLWDVWKAWKRRAPWIPGPALLLRPFIIQLVCYIYYSHISVYSGSRYQTVKVIDTGRLMMCVLIAYFIPGMARSGSFMDGSTLAKLALRITLHVVFEVPSDWKVEKRNESLSALAPSSEGLDRINSYLNHYIVAIILISTIIYLLGLLVHAVMIGGTIRRFISKKVPLAIACCTPNDRSRCNDIKAHVLKYWIALRVCQPDYVFSRSSVCSMLWPIVTSCLGSYIIIRIYIYNESLNSVETLVKLVILGQIVLIGIGWIVLLVRWVTSDGQGNISGEYYIYGMSLRDLQALFIGLFVWDRRIQERMIHDMNRRFRVIPSLLWYSLHWVTSTRQWLSRITTRVNEFISRAVPDNRQFPRYNETLRMLLIPGESARSLWKANQWGFRKVEEYMGQGHEDGKRSPSKLISLLRLGTVTAEGALRQANKNSWKRTAVSLIHFMIYSYNDSDVSAIGDASVIEDAMQCYDQGWEYMDIIDGLDEEVKSLGRQADGEFDSLQHTWNKRAMLDTEIKQPLRQLRAQLESLSIEERRKLQNSWDSTEVAKYCLFETWTVIERVVGTWRVVDPEINQIHRLQRVLANVYFFYMTEGVREAVLQKCRKLGMEEGMDEEILDVAVLAAKAQGVLDKVGEGNDRENPVEPRHNTDPASTSSTIPTEIELVGEGNGQAERSNNIGQTESVVDVGGDDSTDLSFFQDVGGDDSTDLSFWQYVGGDDSTDSDYLQDDSTDPVDEKSSHSP